MRLPTLLRHSYVHVTTRPSDSAEAAARQYYTSASRFAIPPAAPITNTTRGSCGNLPRSHFDGFAALLNLSVGRQRSPLLDLMCGNTH